MLLSAQKSQIGEKWMTLSACAPVSSPIRRRSFIGLRVLILNTPAFPINHSLFLDSLIWPFMNLTG